MPARREALRLELVVVDGEHRDPYQKAGRQVQADGEPDVLEHHRRRRVQSAGVAFSRRGGAMSEESMGQGGGGLDCGSACVGGCEEGIRVRPFWCRVGPSNIRGLWAEMQFCLLMRENTAGFSRPKYGNRQYGQENA